MWRYLRYFVPFILLLPSALILQLVSSSIPRKHDNIIILAVLIFAVFTAFWYLYFTKPGHRLSLIIQGFILLIMIPFLLDLIGIDWISDFFLNDYWGNKYSHWYISFGIILIAFVYTVRFYYKGKHDIFSFLKLLIVLVIVILVTTTLIINVRDILKMFMGTIIILILVLPIIHIVDMWKWEKEKEKDASKLASLDHLIEEISGN